MTGFQNKSSDVFIQDQSSEVISYYFTKTVISPTIVGNFDVDDRIITVSSATSIALDQSVEINCNSRIYQGLVVGISGVNITLNAPLDFAVTDGTVVNFGTSNLNVNGSVTPQIFSIKPPANVKWDINKLAIRMLDTSPMTDDLFGSLTALTNGIILRQKDGYYKNIISLYNNGGFRDRGFRVEYPDKVPSGNYAFSAIGEFNGQNSNGVTLRLNGITNDELQLIIQDDLTGLDVFLATVHGHKVED